MQEAVLEATERQHGRRERKKLETYRRLVAAARELALDRGAETVTVEAIANRADVSVRTFFNYFSSKDDALVGIEPGACDRLREAILSRPRHESPARALQAALSSGDPDDEAAYLWTLRVQLIRRSPTLRAHHLAALHELGLAAAAALAERMGVADDDPAPRVIAGAAIGALAAATDSLAGEMPVSFPDAVSQAFTTLRKAF